MNAMRRNTVSTLRRRRRSSMQEFDALPSDLRAWLAQASLPWSTQSALRLWRRLWRRTGGDTGAILAALSRAEARLIARDAPRVWGAGHPTAQAQRSRKSA